MKKKGIFFVMMFIASIFMIPDVFAAEPAKDQQNQNFFFANGTPITIKAKDGGEGAIITWGEGSSMEVDENTTIFGGSHNADVPSASITMEGGKVKNIVGGGLHGAKVGTVNITINGGTVTGQVVGGGTSSFSGTSCHEWYAGDVQNATTKVEKTIIQINGGTIDTIYGGGEGISYTGTTDITVNNGTITNLIAGGSNGHTGEATVIIENGTITNYQSVNRGSMDSASLTVEGGTITNLYAAAGVAVDETGTIKEANVAIHGGTVTNAHPGKSGGADVSEEIISFGYKEGTVTNTNASEFKNSSIVLVTVTVHVTVEGESLEEEIDVPKGSLFSDISDIFMQAIEEEGGISEIESLGYKFAGFYKDAKYQEKYTDEDAFNTDSEMYMRFIKIETEKEKNPNTSDMNLIALLGIILVSGIGITYVLKKRKFN